MPTPINNLLYDAGGNLSRPANFRIEFFMPAKLGAQRSGNQYDILCKNVSIPETETKKNDITIKGSAIPIKSRVDYMRSLSMTMLVDEKHKVIRDLMTWQRGLDINTLKPDSDIQALQYASKIDLLGSLNLMIQDWNGNPTAKYTFEGIFPIKVGNIDFDSSSTSSFLEVQVEFAFLTMVKDAAIGSDIRGIAQRLIDNTIGTIQEEITGGVSSTLDELNKKITNIGGKAKEAEVSKKFAPFIKDNGE